jgi:very-short-patch-repair endonuclease
MGCSKCAYDAANKKKHQKPINNLKKKLENTGIFFNEEDYKNANTPITFYLEDGTTFKRSPGKILYSNRISLNKRSNGETNVAKILKDLNENFIEEKTFDDLKFINNLYIDFFLEDKKIFIEYDGMQHQNKNSKFYDPLQIKRDEIKNLYAQNNNFRILRIYKKNNHSLTDNQLLSIKQKIQEFFLSSTTIEILEI